MPPLKAQLLLAESLAAYFPEMVFTDSGITVQIHRNTHEQQGPSNRITKRYPYRVIWSHHMTTNEKVHVANPDLAHTRWTPR